tara:strand:+ start:50794 stop:51600 length:807 start_codon:yes stop_codon:yes gene_type:complete
VHLQNHERGGKLNFLAIIGRVVLALFAEIGRLSLFTWGAVSHIFRPPFFWRLLGQQMMRIGYFSLPVVALTAFFTGGALALQIYYGGNNINSESIVSTIVALGITRELGPVLGGLMVAGRVAAAIAAELGTMRVTEQIDALTTLSTNPIKYLVVPRLVAAIITLPLLVLIADIIGVMGGFVAGTASLGFNPGVYINTTVNFLKPDDILSGLFKAGVFGFIIALMGCFHGFNSKGGAQGVGRATTNAVVSASVLILASNYVMTSLLFAK